MTKDQVIDEQLYVIGFCLQHNNIPDIYTLITYGGEYDRPLLQDTSLLFFETPSLTHKALEISTNGLQNIPLHSLEVSLTCYVHHTLELIRAKTHDNASSILNCLNTFFDLINALEPSLSEHDQALLYSFADHMTFHREFGDFLLKNRIKRESLLSSMYQCIKIISSHSLCRTFQGLKECSLWNDILTSEI